MTLAKSKKQRARGKQRPFPRYPLEKAIEVAQKIKELNGGEPWSPQSIATAVNIAQRSSNFQSLISSARDFGLINGNDRSEQISLTDLGREIVYAPDAKTELLKKREAFDKVDIFSKVLAHYKGSALPEMKYLGNTLKTTFGLDEEYHADFSRLFAENTKYLGESTVTDSPTQYEAPGKASSPTVVLAEPDKKRGAIQKAFVIMPFGERGEEPRPTGFFQEVLNALIVPAGKEAGFTVYTANRTGSDVIQSTIINDLLDADLAIADLTDHNPNVLFELGLRIAQDKPVALIKSKDTGRIFDVDNLMRVFEYDQNLWASTVQSDLPNLTDHIRASWSNRDDTQSYLKILRRQAA